MKQFMGRSAHPAAAPRPRTLTISLEPELWALIETYQRRLRTKPTTEVVRRLLWLAPEAEGLAERDD
jgi:hypothetical protein